ncbi:hypothetical protein IFM89_013794 [Coptis chinensis]|uniref:Uncharacterized protein n=1 Tax=Coptis chinensis TaxID=261450 RepID=A0A835HM69_9MAGN|nr:hypothetical protein IFM89_013794 [Coptis chinensis]
MFNGFVEVSMTIAKLPQILQAKRPPLLSFLGICTLPSWILRIPTSFAEVFIWIVLTYYVIGFDPNFLRMALTYEP